MSTGHRTPHTDPTTRAVQFRRAVCLKVAGQFLTAEMGLHTRLQESVPTHLAATHLGTPTQVIFRPANRQRYGSFQLIRSDNRLIFSFLYNA